MCLALAVVESLAAGYEVAVVEDAVGDFTAVEHEIAARRLTQAGAQPNTTVGMMGE